jgi:hypothetical protein
LARTGFFASNERLMAFIERYKARLVAKSFHQQPEINFEETFSLVIKPTMVCTVLSLAISSGWAICQIDVNNAFLHGLLSKEVYRTQPPEFIHPQYPQHLYKLQKTLHGLKQSPLAWFSRPSSRLIAFGFLGSKSDCSSFIYKTTALIMYVLIYVEDIIITYSQPSAIDDLLSQLQCDFAINDLGYLHFFLGIKILHNYGETFLSQHCYILDILTRTKMVDAKSIASPMATSTSLSAFEGDSFEDLTLYRSTVRALQYLCITRLDMSFTVNKLSQFMHKPLAPH